MANINETGFEEVPDADEDIKKNFREEDFEQRLISMVKEYTALYDKTDEKYMSTSYKTRVWKKISTKLQCEDDLVIRRWRYLRDRFTRETKRNTKEGIDFANKKPWIHLTSMEFLKEHIRTRKQWKLPKERDSPSPTNDLDELSQSEELSSQLVPKANINEDVDPDPLANSPFMDRFRKNMSREIDSHYYPFEKTEQTYLDREATPNIEVPENENTNTELDTFIKDDQATPKPIINIDKSFLIIDLEPKGQKQYVDEHTTIQNFESKTSVLPSCIRKLTDNDQGDEDLLAKIYTTRNRKNIDKDYDPYPKKPRKQRGEKTKAGQRRRSKRDEHESNTSCEAQTFDDKRKRRRKKTDSPSFADGCDNALAGPSSTKDDAHLDDNESEEMPKRSKYRPPGKNVEADELLIAEVKRHKSIYDRNDSGYMNKFIQKKLWETIASNLKRDEKVLVKRWRYLRDKYTKEINYVAKPGSKAWRGEWIHFSSLQFLKEYEYGTKKRKKREKKVSLSSYDHDRDDMSQAPSYRVSSFSDDENYEEEFDDLEIQNEEYLEEDDILKSQIIVGSQDNTLESQVQQQFLQHQILQSQFIQPQSLQHQVQFLQPQTIQHQILQPQIIQSQMLQPQLLELQVILPQKLDQQQQQMQPQQQQVVQHHQVQPHEVQQNQLHQHQLQQHQLHQNQLQQHELQQHEAQQQQAQQIQLQQHQIQQHQAQQHQVQQHQVDQQQVQHQVQQQQIEQHQLEQQIQQHQMHHHQVQQHQVQPTQVQQIQQSQLQHEVQQSQMQHHVQQSQVPQNQILQSQALQSHASQPQVLQLTEIPMTKSINNDQNKATISSNYGETDGQMFGKWLGHKLDLLAPAVSCNLQTQIMMLVNAQVAQTLVKEGSNKG